MRSVKPANKAGKGRALFLAAAVILLATGKPGWAASSKPKPSAGSLAPPTAQNYDQCLALARSEPQLAYQRAMTWHDMGGGFPAEHCAAVALVGLKKYGEAAQKLENMAGAMMQADPALRGDALEQAGNAWLLANEMKKAKSDFDGALALKPNDPDILIDRAEAYALEQKFFDAIDDLNHALEIAPKRVDALIYRASAYRQLGTLGLALDDVTRALAIDPNAIAGLLERGNIRRLRGDRAGAKEDWQRIISLAPNSPEAKDARENLARLAAEPPPESGAAATSAKTAANPRRQ
jgi:tetratricopeptide (TPR) repeat protein